MTKAQLLKILEPLSDDAEILIGDPGDEEAIHAVTSAQIGRVDGEPSDFEVTFDSDKPFNSAVLWPA